MGFRDQEDYRVRFDWGPKAVEHLAPLSATVVVVDVLRFTTAVDAAVAKGARVRPLRWSQRGERAATDDYLSAALIAGKVVAGEVVELPSPNGAELSLRAAEAGATVFAACLRNASAVARAAGAASGALTVIACGERWEDETSLRPCVEDLLGAGAVLAALDLAEASPEARLAAAAFRGARDQLAGLVRDCATARELLEKGQGRDFPGAAGHDASPAAPLLREGLYEAAR